MKPFLAFFLVSLALLPTSIASAQPNGSGPYALKSGSKMESGCFAPCLCPVLITEPMQGSFRLQFRDADPLFSNYDVQNLSWSLPHAVPPATIVGSGTYRVGGEFAAQQQMSLDLSIGGGPVQHFDSGVVLGGGTFPSIDVQVSLHQGVGCVDTLITIIAEPATATSIVGSAASLVPGIRAVTPNPFRDEARFEIALPRPEAVRVEVVDLQGRVVRHLTPASTRMAAGVTPMTWDGRNDKGRECATGIYFLRATLGGRPSTARIVRVK